MSFNQAEENSSRLVQIPSIVFLVVTPVFIAVRLASRASISKSLGLDDWTILGSALFSIAISILTLESCKYGFGRHITSLAPDDRITALKLFYICQVCYKVTINMTKSSILLLYLRIFVNKFFRTACWVLLAIISAYLIASAMAAIFQCTPIPRAWDRTISGSCINITTNWYANAGFSIATDVIILLLPMPILYSLRLERSRKAGLMFVFALGGFVVVTSVMRMTTLDLSSKSPDTTYQITSSLWTIIECNVGIVCACLPICRLPLQILFGAGFPHSGFASSDATKRSGTGKFIHASTSRNEWVPQSKSQTSRLASVHVSRNESEEYILQEAEGGKPARSIAAGEIYKITQFKVQYDDKIPEP